MLLWPFIAGNLLFLLAKNPRDFYGEAAKTRLHCYRFYSSNNTQWVQRSHTSRTQQPIRSETVTTRQLLFSHHMCCMDHRRALHTCNVSPPCDWKRRPSPDLAVISDYTTNVWHQPGSSLSEQIKVVVTREEVYVLDMLVMTSAEKVKKYGKFSRTIRRRTNYSEVCQFGKTSQGRLSTTKDCCMLLE